MKNPIGNPKVLKSSTYPPGQCCGCGTRWRLRSLNGVSHCPKPACVRKAAQIAMGD